MTKNIYFLKYRQVNEVLTFLGKFQINKNYLNKKYFKDFFKIKKKGLSKCKILKKENKIIGFRGGVENLFFYSKKKKFFFLKGIENLLWFSSSKIIKDNLDLLLEKKAYKLLTSTGFGVVGKFYHKSDYQFLNLIRHVKPIEEKLFKTICKKKKNISLIKKNFTQDCAQNPENINSLKLEKIWKKISKSINIFSRYRNKNFWNWRYKNCQYYKYISWICPNDSGAVVARVEKVLDKKFKKRQLLVLRIIEILPSSNLIWNGKRDTKFENFFSSILNWCSDKKFTAVDFFISGNYFDNFLKKFGFYKSSKKNNNFQIFPSIFKPLDYNKRPINIAFKLKSKENFLNNKKIKNYFVKSDGGGDFPPTNFSKKDVLELNKINSDFINE